MISLFNCYQFSILLKNSNDVVKYINAYCMEEVILSFTKNPCVNRGEEKIDNLIQLDSSFSNVGLPFFHRPPPQPRPRLLFNYEIAPSSSIEYNYNTPPPPPPPPPSR